MRSETKEDEVARRTSFSSNARASQAEKEPCRWLVSGQPSEANIGEELIDRVQACVRALRCMSRVALPIASTSVRASSSEREQVRSWRVCIRRAASASTPIAHSGMASSVRSVNTRYRALHANPTPNPIVTPSMIATDGVSRPPRSLALLAQRSSASSRRYSLDSAT